MGHIKYSTLCFTLIKGNYKGQELPLVALGDRVLKIAIYGLKLEQHKVQPKVDTNANFGFTLGRRRRRPSKN